MPARLIGRRAATSESLAIRHTSLSRQGPVGKRRRGTHVTGTILTQGTFGKTYGPMPPAVLHSVLDHDAGHARSDDEAHAHLRRRQRRQQQVGEVRGRGWDDVIGPEERLLPTRFGSDRPLRRC
jgi:hypothetical protein